ncbi:unnamed protein product [Sphagnum tenellum]
MSSSVVIGTMPKAAACCNIGSSFWRGAGGAALSSSPVGGGGCLPDRTLKLVMTRAVSSTSVTMVRKDAGMTTKIKSIKARQIIDIRGNPTVEVDVVTDVVSGRLCPVVHLTGSMRLWSFEMGEKSVYGGKGVVEGVENINNLLAPELLGFGTRKEMDIDNITLELDGTPNKGKCGANATLGVSVSLC